MKLRSKKIAGIAAATLALALAASGCGKGAGDDSSSDGGGSSKTQTITFIPKNLGNPYFDTSDAGGKKAVEEFGGKYSQVGPQEASPDAQAQYIDTAAQKRTSAIVMSANDPEALGDSMTKARDAGTKIVTFDSDTNPKYRDVFINQATTEGLGKVQVDMIADQIGDAGEIAILSATANATNQNAWIAVMKKELKNHPKIKLVETAYGNDDDQTSFDKTAALLQKHPNLKGIISPTTVGIAAAARYLSTLVGQGQGHAHRSRTPERHAQVRQGRHRQGVRAVEPGGPRLPRGVRRARPGQRGHQGRGRRQVQGRQAG